MTAIKSVMQAAPEMPVQHLEVFLYIADHEGTSNTDIAAALGVDEQTCSRRVLYLTERSYNKGKGLGLVKQTIDPMELRRKHLELTESGKRLRDTLKGILA